MPTAPRGGHLLHSITGTAARATGPVFTLNAPQIGLTTQLAAASASATTLVSGALLAQEQPKQAYHVATQRVEDGPAALRSSAGDTVRLIRAFAESQPKPSVVYNLAQIPPPAQLSPAPPPGSPTACAACRCRSGSDGAVATSTHTT